MYKTYSQPEPIVILIRLPDPRNIFRIFEGFEKGPVAFSNVNYLVLLLITISIVTALVVRWVFLYLFYKSLAHEDIVSRKEVPEIYAVIDDYVQKTKTKAPYVSLTHRHYFSPFIIGIRNFALVLSPKLMDILNTSEKEVLIQHELSHIKRNDNLISWIALILRDLLFFNPFSYIAYSLIKSEQEKDSDKLMVRYTGKPVKKIAKNILNVILKIKSISTSKPISEPAHSFTSLPLSSFSQFRLRNRINSILKTDPHKIYSRIFPKILMCILFLAILIIQLMFIININNYYIFLR
ncbi:MAG: M48 family metalloprotease [Actinobacteria bacterium]|nr:M48 family metalloprotease [Chloroflexota bacterium]MBE3128277.1 M48 family metalloprotease [Actinomycetota bacterium]